MSRFKVAHDRKPSLKTVVGLTKATKRAKKAVGITAAMKPIRAPGNLKRTTFSALGLANLLL